MLRLTGRLCLLGVLGFASTWDAWSQTFIRERDDRLVPFDLHHARQGAIQQPPPILSSASCALIPGAWSGSAVPGGGTLGLARDQATVNATGRLAFFSAVAGVARNQAIFVSDGGVLHAVVTGCGAGGGTGNPGSACGDPSPIGGTFSGLFGGTPFAPAVNDRGDVLFLADLAGASAPRGLFLFRQSTQSLTKVAAVGDPSPLAGSFGAVGPGSLNNQGQVVFLASQPGHLDSNVFSWTSGVVTKIAAVGDPAPGGGVFNSIGTEALGAVDGTHIPTGPVPDINDQGQVSFRAGVTGGPAIGGLIVSSNGTHAWYVKVGDTTPAGGTYSSFFAPILNGQGQIAFFADFDKAPGEFSSGWFVGSPGAWRKALAFFDGVDGGEVWGLAVSRNPMSPLDDHGNLHLWCDIAPSGGAERQVVSTAAGDLRIDARFGDATPLGGQLGTLNAWPSSRGCLGTVSAVVSGSPSTGSGHFLVDATPPPVAGLQAQWGTPAPGTLTLSWTDPSASSCTPIRFDVMRGTLGALRAGGYPGGGVCAGTGLSSPSYSESGVACPAGVNDGCWYLVRARNDCGASTFGAPALDTLGICP